MKRTVEMMRMAMAKHVKKGLGSIVRYCNTLTPLTLLETQGVPLGNVRDFIKLDQTRQLQVAARQDNTTEKTTGLRKLKAQKPSMLSQLGKKASINQKQDEGMGMDMEMDGIKISVSVPKHLNREARKFLDTMRIAVEEIKKLNKQLEPSGKKSIERTHEPKSKELELSRKKSMKRTPEPKSKEIVHASRKGKVGCFEVLREATQYFDYNDYLLKNCDYIKHNSSPEQMLETLREDLTAKFPILSEDLLRSGMRHSIHSLASVHMVEVVEKFCFFLSSCKFIEHDMKTLDADVELIKQLEEFPREFSELSRHLIVWGLKIYKEHLKRRCDINKDEWRSDYEDSVWNSFGILKKGFLQLTIPFIDPLYKMVSRTYVAGYKMDMDGDPKTEVSKIKKKFKELQRVDRKRGFFFP